MKKIMLPKQMLQGQFLKQKQKKVMNENKNIKEMHEILYNIMVTVSAKQGKPLKSIEEVSIEVFRGINDTDTFMVNLERYFSAWTRVSL